jgi:hypothetical protein
MRCVEARSVDSTEHVGTPTAQVKPTDDKERHPRKVKASKSSLKTKDRPGQACRSTTSFSLVHEYVVKSDRRAKK